MAAGSDILEIANRHLGKCYVHGSAARIPISLDRGTAPSMRQSPHMRRLENDQRPSHYTNRCPRRRTSSLHVRLILL